MTLKTFALAVGAAVIAAIAAPSQAASLRVYPMVVDSETSRGSINIINEGREPVVLEAYGTPATGTAAQLGVFPPVATIAPGVKQVFRLVMPVVTAGGQTQAWRLTVREVGKKDAPGGVIGSAVKQELSFDLPVFANHNGSSADLVREGSSVKNAGKRQALITAIGDQKTLKWLLPGEAITAPVGSTLTSGDAVLTVRDAGAMVTAESGSPK